MKRKNFLHTRKQFVLEKKMLFYIKENLQYNTEKQLLLITCNTFVFFFSSYNYKIMFISDGRILTDNNIVTNNNRIQIYNISVPTFFATPIADRSLFLNCITVKPAGVTK